jgi:hypothetical protein
MVAPNLRRCDVIEDRKLRPGTMLVARHKGKEHRCEVVAGEVGKPRYRLADGREFKSPSSAGSAVMSGVACNGWRFWSVGSNGDDGARGEAKPAKRTTKKGTRSARALPKTKPQGKVKVGRNGHKPEVRLRGRVRR